MQETFECDDPSRFTTKGMRGGRSSLAKLSVFGTVNRKEVDGRGHAIQLCSNLLEYGEVGLIFCLVRMWSVACLYS